MPLHKPRQVCCKCSGEARVIYYSALFHKECSKPCSATGGWVCRECIDNYKVNKGIKLKAVKPTTKEGTPVDGVAVVTEEGGRFAELQAKGWKNLNAEERKEYKKLKQ